MSEFSACGTDDVFPRGFLAFVCPVSRIYRAMQRGSGSNTLVIGYCDFHPVTRISAFDTILPIPNRAKNAILLF